MLDLPDLPADVLAAYTAVAALFVSLVALLREIRHTRTVRQVDLMLKYDDLFNSDRIRRDRLSLCRFLQTKRPHDHDDPEWGKVGPVLDFFQGLAFYTRAGALPLAFVHGDYFYWFSHYWAACEPYVTEERKTTDLYLEDAIWLHAKCMRIDAKKNAGKFTHVGQVEIDDFLEYEITNLSSNDAYPSAKARPNAPLAAAAQDQTDG